MGKHHRPSLSIPSSPGLTRGSLSDWNKMPGSRPGKTNLVRFSVNSSALEFGAAYDALNLRPYEPLHERREIAGV